MHRKSSTAAYLVKAARARHIIELFIKQYPVHKSMRFGLGNRYSRIPQELVDIVIDGGYGGNIASTVVDCTSGEFEIVREGKGELEMYL